MSQTLTVHVTHQVEAYFEVVLTQPPSPLGRQLEALKNETVIKGSRSKRDTPTWLFGNSFGIMRGLTAIEYSSLWCKYANRRRFEVERKRGNRRHSYYRVS